MSAERITSPSATECINVYLWMGQGGYCRFLFGVGLAARLFWGWDGERERRFDIYDIDGAPHLVPDAENGAQYLARTGFVGSRAAFFGALREIAPNLIPPKEATKADGVRLMRLCVQKECNKYTGEGARAYQITRGPIVLYKPIQKGSWLRKVATLAGEGISF